MEARNRGVRHSSSAEHREEIGPMPAPAPPPGPGRCRSMLRRLLFVLFLLYVATPLIISCSSWAQDAIVFVHHVRTPYFMNISDPASFDLKAAREFELVHGDSCSIQIWQILPKRYHTSNGVLSEDNFTAPLSDGAPVILYMHGNTGTRATEHRIMLYKYLSEILGYHVITFDYRGFGNSVCYPSERGMMEDGMLIWQWVQEKAPGAKIYIWGHSLGSAAATYLTKELCQLKDLPIPAGLILEAPFPDIATAGENHPFSIPYWPIMPLFRCLILQRFEQKFKSVERMDYIRTPILILHGHGDSIVPFHLGKQMHEAALESRKRNEVFGKVEFVDCGDEGHRTAWEAPQAKKAIKRFAKQ